MHNVDLRNHSEGEDRRNSPRDDDEKRSKRRRVMQVLGRLDWFRLGWFLLRLLLLVISGDVSWFTDLWP